MNMRIAKKTVRNFPHGFNFPLSTQDASRITRAHQRLGLPVPPLQTLFGGPESVMGAACQKDMDALVMGDLLSETPSRMRGQTTDYVYLDDKVDIPGDFLEDLKVSELKARCKAQGLKGYSKLKKAGLVLLLEQGD